MNATNLFTSFYYRFMKQIYRLFGVRIHPEHNYRVFVNASYSTIDQRKLPFEPHSSPLATTLCHPRATACLTPLFSILFFPCYFSCRRC